MIIDVSGYLWGSVLRRRRQPETLFGTEQRWLVVQSRWWRWRAVDTFCKRCSL